MEMLVASRNGTKTLTARFDTHPDGTLWYNNMPLIDGESPEARELGKDKLVELVKTRRFIEIPAGCFAKMGLNPSGLLVQRYAEIETEQEAKSKAYLAEHPEVMERAEIDKLLARGRKINDDWSEEADTGKGFSFIAEAEERLKAWRAMYPEAAREEDARELEAQADHEEDIARGALVYDADGDISREEQVNRHREGMAKAANLRVRAAEIRRG